MTGHDDWRIQTFLDVLVRSMGARRAALWRLDGNGQEWAVEAEATAGASSKNTMLPAEGHPFTWSAREDLVLQVLSGELFKAAAEGEWSLAAPLTEWQRLLCISFAGTPGVNARQAIEAAVRHLRAIAPWDEPGW